MRQNTSLKKRFLQLPIVAGSLMLGAMMVAQAETASLDDVPEPDQLLPEDQAERDPNLEQFRKEMLQAVRFKEPERLVRYIDLNVNNGPFIGPGMQTFAKVWRIDAIDSPLWVVLEDILSMGGAFVRSNRGAQFCAPYVFTHFPNDRNIQNHAAIVEPNIAIRKSPEYGSEILQRVSHKVVKVEDWTTIDRNDNGIDVSWLHVRLSDGTEGYVEKAYVRSPLDYHACFILRHGKWKMTALSSSDLQFAQTVLPPEAKPEFQDMTADAEEDEVDLDDAGEEDVDGTQLSATGGTSAPAEP
jgi:hypothetical protein